MQAEVLDVPPVVTGQERADEWADQLEDLLLEVGRIFPRADLRCRAAACVRGLLGPLSRKNGWQFAEHAGDSRPDGQQHLLNRACWDVDELRDEEDWAELPAGPPRPAPGHGSGGCGASQTLIVRWGAGPGHGGSSPGAAPGSSRSGTTSSPGGPRRHPWSS